MTPQVLTLGTATYDPRDMVLRDATGVEISLTNKAREVLACLADAAGEAVAQETILGTVWPERPGGAEALPRVVAELRSALDDGEGAILREVPRMGYQLLGGWRDAPDEPVRPRRRLWRWIALAVLLLIVLLRLVERI